MERDGEEEEEDDAAGDELAESLREWPKNWEGARDIADCISEEAMEAFSRCLDGQPEETETETVFVEFTKLASSSSFLSHPLPQLGMENGSVQAWVEPFAECLEGTLALTGLLFALIWMLLSWLKYSCLDAISQESHLNGEWE